MNPEWNTLKKKENQVLLGFLLSNLYITKPVF